VKNAVLAHTIHLKPHKDTYQYSKSSDSKGFSTILFRKGVQWELYEHILAQDTWLVFWVSRLV